MKHFKHFCILLALSCSGTFSYHQLDEIDEDVMHPRLSVRRSRATNFNILETGSKYWNENAQNRLLKQLGIQQIRGVAKNVILFLGDGMSIPTLAATRVYLGQLRGTSGEQEELYFEKMPFTGLSKTYCVNKQVPDSACTSTAYMCGVKNNYGTLGVTAAVTRGDCHAMRNKTNQVDSIIKWAQDSGKGTGIVTTTRVTHASPAGGYSHVAERGWESDANVVNNGLNPELCHDIAKQLVHQDPGRNIKVILGGGRQMFRSVDVYDEEGARGNRLDGEDLIRTWQHDKQLRGYRSHYAYNRDGLLQVNPNHTDYLLGLFEASHMKYHLDADPAEEPTLAEMTFVAIKMLQKEKKGFFLFVEGGRIDQAHHATQAHKALDETVQFHDAIRVAKELTNESETLIVVTSDHAHVMTFNGYPDRSTNIFGISGLSSVDNLPYSKLSYGNGPGYKPPSKDGSRYDISQDDMQDKDYEFPALAPLGSETHGGDDVGIFASGPWAHLFTGVMEQNVIPHIMAFASCIGNGLTACWDK